MEDNLAHPYNRRRILTINDLPDEVLLAIFDFHVFKFYMIKCQYLHFLEVVLNQKEILSWRSLVHVCRRWRGLVFASPRRLNLQLCCTTRKPARKILDVWPALPLLIHGNFSEGCSNNVIAQLEHSDRIGQINLYLPTFLQIEKLSTAMQVPFPELAGLFLRYGGYSSESVLPDSFLGGSAPRLRFLALDNIPFPGLPKFLLSATHLVKLFLHNIPDYISPQAMSTCLSMLTRLEALRLAPRAHPLSPLPSPDDENRRSPPPTRSILPALTNFWYHGFSGYLEELVVRIDTPRLYRLRTTFYNYIGFDPPELIQFITQTFEALKDAYVIFDFDGQTVWVTLQRQAPSFADVRVGIRGWNAQIGTMFLPLLSTMENLFICEPVDSKLDWEENIWSELLLPFTAVKNLYLSKQIAPHIAPALEMVGGRATEVLSTLQNLYLEGFHPSESVHEGIDRFISVRQLANRPVAISVWDRDLVRCELEVDD